MFSRVGNQKSYVLTTLGHSFMVKNAIFLKNLTKIGQNFRFFENIFQEARQNILKSLKNYGPESN